MDCTSSCRLPSHADAILSAITREDLAIFITVLKRVCSNSGNLTDRLGRHAIHIAASCGKTEILQWLIEDCKVNVELKDLENDWTALHRAVFYGQINCAVLLLQHGADMYALDKENLTPLDLLLIDSPFKLSTSVDGKVIASYDTKLDDELCLHMDDVITNIHMSGSSYWTGNLNGTRGFFPKSCVELIRQDYRSDLYTWGINTNFTLGHQDESVRHHPEMIDTFSNDRTICIAELVMCKFHTLFLSQDGRLFSCGHGRGGRLGHGNEQTQLAPKRVEGLKDHKCVAIAAAHNHTMVVTDSGAVFTFGLNDMHQLGHTPAPSQCLLPRMIQMKPWRGKHMIGVSAGQYHSVIYTHNEVFTCGLNIGQLGHLKGEKFITTPRQVTSLYHKDINIAMVTCCDSATLCATSKGDIFILSQFTCQKIITRFMELTRLVVCGGEVELNTNLEVIKYHDKPTLTLLNGNGLVYQWKESYRSLRKCKWMSKKELIVADIAVGKQLYVITDGGELYACIKAGGDAPVTKPTRSSSSASANITNKNNWDQNEVVVHYEVKRCPMVHRGIRIFTDSKSKVFAVLRVDPSTGLKFHPVVSPSTICNDFKQLLEETVVEDDIHDVNLLVKGHVIPAHQFILASKSAKFLHLLTETSDTYNSDDTVRTLKMENVEYEEVVRYVKDLYSGLNVDDTVLFGTKKAHKTPKHHHHDNNQQQNNLDQRPQHKHQHQQEPIANSTNGSHSEFDLDFLKDLEFLSMEDLEEFTTVTDISHDSKKKANGANGPAMTSAKKNKKQNEQNQRINSKKETKNLLKKSFKGLKFKRANCSEMCDVTIESQDGVQFSCHKCVLIARLDYFRSMLAYGWLETSKEMRALTMPIDSSVLEVVLDYLYTDQAKIVKSDQNIEFIGNVMVIADQLLILRLREICEAAMAKLICHRNVMELLEFSCVYNADQLKLSCLEYICNNLGSLMELGYLGSLDEESLQILSKAYKDAIPRMPWRMITPQFDHVYALTPEPSSSSPKKRRSSARKRSAKSESEVEVVEDCSKNGDSQNGSTVEDHILYSSSRDENVRDRSISEAVNDVVFETVEDIDESTVVDEDRDMKDIAKDNQCEVNSISPGHQADTGQWYRKKNDFLEGKRSSKSQAKTRGSFGNKEQKQTELTKRTDIPESKPKEQPTSPKCPWGSTSATSPSSSGFRAIMEQELLSTPPFMTTTVNSPNTSKSETRGKQSQKQRKRALFMQEKENTQMVIEKEDTMVKDTKLPVNPWVIPSKNPTPVRSLRELMDQEEKSQQTLSKSSIITPPIKPKPIEKTKDKPANKTSKISWGLRHLEQTEARDDNRDDIESPTSPKSAWQSLGSSPPSTSVSFADILHLQERENTNLTRKKPLNLIQVEDRAIEELLEHYGGRSNACEMITVERVPTSFAIPVWNRSRTESAMKS